MAHEFFLLHDDFLSTTKCAEVKFCYRRNFLPQLTRLRQHLIDDNAPSEMNFLQENVIKLEGFDFLPLVTLKSRRIIDLEITLLTECEPGCRVKYPTGDIDNYVKALIDGTRAPHAKNEVRRECPTKEEEGNPFFVVMEDDQIVRSLKVTHHKNYRTPTKKKRGRGAHVFALIKVIISEKYCL